MKSELNQDELILNLLKVKCTLIELDYYNLLGRVGLIFVLLEYSPTKFLKITNEKRTPIKGAVFVLFSKLPSGTNDLKESNLLPVLNKFEICYGTKSSLFELTKLAFENNSNFVV